MNTPVKINTTESAKNLAIYKKNYTSSPKECIPWMKDLSVYHTIKSSGMLDRDFHKIIHKNRAAEMTQGVKCLP